MFKKRLGQVGCLATSITALAAAMTGKNLTPDMLDRYIDEKPGGWDKSDNMPWAKACAWLSSEAVGWKVSKMTRSGWEVWRPTMPTNPHILEVRTSRNTQHFVVMVTWHSDKEATVMDPGSSHGIYTTLSKERYTPVSVRVLA